MRLFLNNISKYVEWRYLVLTLFSIAFIIFLYCQFFIQTESAAFTFQNSEAITSSAALNESTILNDARPLILFWTRIFGKKTLRLNPDCPIHDKCVLTYDHGNLLHADAIVYHVPDILWSKTSEPLLPSLPDNSRRINVFLSQENPNSILRYYRGKELSQKTQNFFHWLITYLHSSHVPMPYDGFWLSPEQTAKLGFEPIQLPHDRETILKDKSEKKILWLVSNCNTSSQREVAIEALSKYFPVTIGGYCAKTPEAQRLCPKGTKDDCASLYAKYYFYIAAENDICQDYVTEKYSSRYMLPAVPIVLRQWVYQGFVPNNSYIALDQFAGPKALADYLHHLIDNPDDYLKYFEWRSQNWSIAPWNHEGFRMGQCALCEKLLRRANGTEPEPSPLPDAFEWFKKESKCEGGEFAQHWAAQISEGH